MEIFYSTDNHLIIRAGIRTVEAFYTTDNRFIISSEEILPELGLTVGDVIAMYEDRSGRSFFPSFVKRQNFK